MFKNILKKIAKQLNESKIPYMVIGGQAILLYGEPRLTKDIDVTPGIGVEGLERIKNIIEKPGLLFLLINPRKAGN